MNRHVRTGLALLAALGVVATALPAAADPAPAPAEAVRRAVEARVRAWEAAQNRQDFKAYLALYDPVGFAGVRRADGQVRTLDFAGWKADRAPMFRRPHAVKADGLEVRTWHDDRERLPAGVSVARFVQRWRSGTWADHGRKVLRFRQGDDGVPRIVGEELLESLPGWEGDIAVPLPAPAAAVPDPPPAPARPPAPRLAAGADLAALDGTRVSARGRYGALANGTFIDVAGGTSLLLDPASPRPAAERNRLGGEPVIVTGTLRAACRGADPADRTVWQCLAPVESIEPWPSWGRRTSTPPVQPRDCQAQERADRTAGRTCRQALDRWRDGLLAAVKAAAGRGDWDEVAARVTGVTVQNGYLQTPDELASEADTWLPVLDVEGAWHPRKDRYCRESRRDTFPQTSACVVTAGADAGRVEASIVYGE